MILMYNEVSEHQGNNLLQSHTGDLGFDIRSGVGLTIYPHEQKEIYTGLHICLPFYLGALILSRSGLSFKKGIHTLGAGVIDSGFRGAVKVLLYNTSEEPYIVRCGDRVAQIVFQLNVRGFFDVLDDQFSRVAEGSGTFALNLFNFEISECPMDLWPVGQGRRGEKGYGSSGV